MNQLKTGAFSEIWTRNWKQNLFQPVDNSFLVLFRILFGAIMFWEVTRYFRYGWINRYWIEPYFNFSYAPFNFQPLPGDGMFVLWLVLGLLAICITIGLFYRISATLFFLLFTYTYLLEQARYLNHFYLVVLISFLMIFVPAHRNFSIDMRIWKRIRSPLAPLWTLWLIRFIISVPYFFGGVAKLNPDWLQGYPLAIWLNPNFPILGQYFEEQWMVLFISYAGLLLDLLIVPFLIWKKSRWPAFIFITLFHLMNSQLFSIGIFPWFMIGATTMFFPPSWPRKALQMISDKVKSLGSEELTLYSEPSSPRKKLVLWALGLFVAIQVFLPLRHWLIPGNVHWTEGGHRYSWHMKLRSKDGQTTFILENKENSERIFVDLDGYLKDWQIDDMNGMPYMIWEFAQFLKEEYALMGVDIAVYAEAVATLNDREPQYIIDPNVDLTSVSRPWFGWADWYEPLESPLRKKW
ncbi:MAG: HTTM domain-containing protein [Roseivirga sp.]|uniref:HTTM domain-containing protein n=1 Tax=Roseivirga sp. TaxID=1964215 RepID=UPI001B2B73A8|nr:HTTM domain-containing protein [Roseivirga sp.]MBO6662491.1 HTTM domain-containing protein [Roseivirga sp.]MBO6761125.1 HTTM domain-containing protein [Roseivirga sp.]MBO6909946.1 HTTM domain-containing protein [Roseivirga sp.]